MTAVERSTKHAFAFVWVTVLIDMIGLALIMPILSALLRQLREQDKQRGCRSFERLLGKSSGRASRRDDARLYTVYTQTQ